MVRDEIAKYERILSRADQIQTIASLVAIICLLYSKFASERPLAKRIEHQLEAECLNPQDGCDQRGVRKTALSRDLSQCVAFLAAF